MILEYLSFTFLAVSTFVLTFKNLHGTAQVKRELDNTEKRIQYRNLRYRYLLVYLLATFSDWLQGPYVYRLYHDYGFEDSTISNLFLIGFVSSTLFSTIGGYLADCYGRKKMCITFCVLYAVCCITKAYPNFWILVVGRILGGIATSILFSAFSAWYIHEHQQRLQLPPEWMNDTFALGTFLNGCFAIVAGVVSGTATDVIGWGPLAPFMIAIPVLITAATVSSLCWEENCGCDVSLQSRSLKHSIIKPLHLIVCSRDKTLLHLGLVQVMFEPAMYTFVIAWSPLLSKLDFSLGFIFSAFMVCIMLGSVSYTAMTSPGRSTPDQILRNSMRVATVAMLGVTVLTTSTMSHTSTQLCYLFFLLFEISVGIYYPAWGYLASRTVPEEFRASLASWFRLPMNILTCICLHWTSVSKENDKSHSQFDPTLVYHPSFLMCSFLLIAACWSSERFSFHYIQRDTGTSSGLV